MKRPLPRILVAGTSGDSGKTVISLGLLAAARREGLPTAAFKKGPDFIDAAWLSWAAGRPARNLDTFMVGRDEVANSFRRHAVSEGLNLIEGNRGLLDGVDAAGSHSSASLARLTRSPVLLVLSPVKVTATAAATVVGLRKLAPDVAIAGVILNQVAGERHRSVVTQAIEQHAQVTVLGAVPRIDDPLLTSRHLGLIPPAEHEPAADLHRRLAELVTDHCDLARIWEIARGAQPLAQEPATPEVKTRPAEASAARVKIGYFSDSAFTFYYVENLEALRAAGAELIAISALSDTRFPEIDALYIGGGFPETHTAQLADNRELHVGVKRLAAAGLPIYAECGGLMYLARRLELEDREVALAGVLPITVKMHRRPQGHGYARVTVDRPNPIFAIGTELVGHEFHYSTLAPNHEAVETAYAVTRGTGIGAGRDGIVQNQVLASYLHLHASGSVTWAAGLIAAARRYREGDAHTDREG